MSFPVQVTFRDIDHSDAVESHIRERAAKLETFFSRITSCRVVVEAPHKHHHAGRRFRVSVDISLPGHDLVVNDLKEDDPTNENAYSAIDQAFDRLARRLEDLVRRQRGDVKARGSV